MKNSIRFLLVLLLALAPLALRSQTQPSFTVGGFSYLGNGNFAVGVTAGGVLVPIQVQADGTVVTSGGGGGGGGGTSSNFAAAFPTAGTAAGFKDSTGVNMTFGKVNASNALVVDEAFLSGVAVSVGNGVVGTGVQRVTLASDSTGQVTLATGSNTIGALTANQSVNVNQVAGSSASVGEGASGAGVLRVTVAQDSRLVVPMVSTQGGPNSSINIAINNSGGSTAAVDTQGYSYISFNVPVTGTVSAGVITFEGSPDNSNFVAFPLYDAAAPTAAPVSSYTPATGVTRYFFGPIPFQWVRIRISTALTGGGGVGWFGEYTRQPIGVATPSLAAGSNLIGVVGNAQASTTSGQSGPLVQGAVTTAAPSYTTAQTDPLSLTTAGSLRTDTSTIAGNTISTGTGASDTGTQRVMMANDAWQDLAFTGQAAQTATVNNIIPAAVSANATDVTGYKSGSIQVVSTGTGGTFIFEGSNDNTNFQTIPVYSQLILTGTPITAAITASSSQLIYTFPLQFRYVRLRIATTITGGSIQAFSDFKQSAWTPGVFQVAQATGGNLNAVITSGTVTTVTTLTTLANGQTAHSSASTGSPVRVGGRVNTTLDTTLVQGDASDVFVTTAGQLVQKPFGTQENDWSYVSPASGTITNSTTPVAIAPARAASIHNFITSISLSADALGTATEVAVRDVALTASSQTISSNILVTSTAHGLSIGDTVVPSASTVTGFSAGTTYYVLTVPSATNLTFSATPGGSTLAISGTGVTATLNHYLWRQKLQTAGLVAPVLFQFLTPLRGGTAVADEVVTLTASTGGVYFNCTGYQSF